MNEQAPAVTPGAPVKVRTATVLAATMFALGLLFSNPGWIKPDSVATYAYLRSAIIDRDLSFLNEWRGFGLIPGDFPLFKEMSSDGRIANHWNVGTSILSAPFFLLAHLIAMILGFQKDGVSGIYTVTLAWAAIAFTTAALLIAWIIARRESEGSFWIASAAVTLGTPLFFYTYRMPLGSHAAGTLMIALLTWALLTDRDVAAPTPFLIGVLYGFAAATRLQHAALGGAVALRGAQKNWRASDWAKCAAGTILGWSPQGAAWWVIYDTPFGPLVKGSSLAGSTWYPFRDNALLEVLFSGWHGLFSWSPVVLLAIAGWVLRARTRSGSWILMAMFAGEWFANGLLDRYFWGGMSFGARRFLDLAVPFIIGLVWLIDAVPSRRARAALLVVIALAVAWSGGLLLLTLDGRLDLVRTVSIVSLSAAVVSLVNHAPSLVPAIIAMPSLHVVAGIVSAILLALFYWLASKKKRVMVLAAVSALVLVDLAIVALRPKTLRNASAAARQFGINPVRADLGPLLDQRNLLRDLLEHRQRSGDARNAESLSRELAAVDRAIATRAPR